MYNCYTQWAPTTKYEIQNLQEESYPPLPGKKGGLRHTLNISLWTSIIFFNTHLTRCTLFFKGMSSLSSYEHYKNNDRETYPSAGLEGFYQQQCVLVTKEIPLSSLSCTPHFSPPTVLLNVCTVCAHAKINTMKVQFLHNNEKNHTPTKALVSLINFDVRTTYHADSPFSSKTYIPQTSTRDLKPSLRHLPSRHWARAAFPRSCTTLFRHTR